MNFVSNKFNNRLYSRSWNKSKSSLLITNYFNDCFKLKRFVEHNVEWLCHQVFHSKITKIDTPFFLFLIVYRFPLKNNR